MSDRWLYQALAEPFVIETITVDKWFRPASEPVLDEPHRLLLGGVYVAEPSTFTVETITLDKWYRPASEPVRMPPPVLPGCWAGVLEPTLFETPTMDTWYRPASEPTRRLPPVPVGGATYQGEPSLVVSAVITGIRYVRAAGGDDAEDGTTYAKGWATLAYASGKTYGPGAILYGDGAFRESWTFAWSGTDADNKIKLADYGNGTFQINGADDVTAESWNNLGGNLWWCSLANAAYLVAFDGVLGTRETGSGQINQAGEWWWDSGTQRLYVYSVGDPSGAGVTIEAGQRACINVNDQDYIAIDGVECRHGQLADEESNLSIGGGFHFTEGGSTGCTLDNCLATRCHGFGFNFQNVHGLVATDCLAVDVVNNGETTHGDGFHVGSRWSDHTPPTNVVLDGCDVQGTIARQGCSVTSGVTIEILRGHITADAINSVDIEPHAGETVVGVVVHQMLIAPTGGNGIKLSNGNGTLTGGVAKHNIVMDVEEATYGIGIVVSETQDAKVFGNLTIGWEYPFRNENGVMEAYNNTLAETRRHAIRTISGGTTTAKNNVVYVASDAISPTCIYDATGNGTYENNLYFADNGTVYFYDGSWRLTLAAWQGQGFDLESTQEDPLFVDPATDDYSLGAGSPAIIGGEDLGDACKWGLDPATVFPDDVRLLDRDIYGWGRGAYVWPVVPGPYRVTYQGAYAAGGTFRHAYHPDGDKHAHAAGADLQHADPAGNSE